MGNENNITWTERIVALAIVLLAIGTIFFSINRNDTDNLKSSQITPSNVDANLPEDGIIASSLLQGSENSVLGTNNNQSQEEAETPASDSPGFTFQPPAGWTQKSIETVDNPCEPESNKKWTTAVYVNDREQITIYENGNPNECSNGIVSDVYLDYDFTENEDSIVVYDENIVFCDLSTPGCPKGDGKVSIFIANEIDEPGQNMFEANSLNGNSYYFSILDTKVDPDLDNQVRTLVQLVELIEFN